MQAGKGKEQSDGLVLLHINAVRNRTVSIQMASRGRAGTAAVSPLVDAGKNTGPVDRFSAALGPIGHVLEDEAERSGVSKNWWGSSGIVFSQIPTLSQRSELFMVL